MTYGGNALDWAVVKAIGKDAQLSVGGYGVLVKEGDFASYFTPSTNWGHAGPLFDEYKVSLQRHSSNLVTATIVTGEHDSGQVSSGIAKYAITAGLHAIVRWKLGESVAIPKELVV